MCILKNMHPVKLTELSLTIINTALVKKRQCAEKNNLWQEINIMNKNQ